MKHLIYSKIIVFIYKGLNYKDMHTGFFLVQLFQVSFTLFTFLSMNNFYLHVTSITKIFFCLTQFPITIDQFSATDVFNTSIQDLPRTRLIQKRRNLLTLLNGDAFYPLSTCPQHIQQLFWKKPIGDTDTFKLMLFFLGNGCSQHLTTEWILTPQHWTSIKKGIKRARQINFIISNLDSKGHIWFYYEAHLSWL